jgi:2-dehydro-3-deoxygalactonokinase
MREPTPPLPALIALDWGTSSLRGFLMAADGSLCETRSAAHGILALPEPGGVAGFERAFAEIAGDWLARRPQLPVVAGGMVGSAQGWVEAPYVATPADTSVLAERAATVTTSDGVRILIAPGVVHDPADAPPDVMRGEEIQIAGALARRPEIAAAAWMVMPGTHSKWVEIVDGRIVRFATHMTGELFALLRRQSILGRLMPEEAATGERAEAAFLDGLAAARGGALAHRLFSVRTLGLMKRLDADLLEDRLSGLLIGHEIVSALADGGIAGLPLVVVGDGRLSRRYARALRAFGLEPTAELGNTAPEGLFRFAVAAGLVESRPGEKK